MSSRDSADGMVRVNLEALRRFRMAKGWAPQTLMQKSQSSKQTFSRIHKTGKSRFATVRALAEALGVDPLDLIDPAEYEPAVADPTDAEARRSTVLESSAEWLVGRPLTDVRTASNGLQHRVFRMQHRHLPTRFGRGKRYELSLLPDEAADRLRAKLLRHIEVCDLVGRSEQFPLCYATYPESGRWVWWVIDEWVEGAPLDQSLAKSSPTIGRVAVWASELGRALDRLHRAGVIRRELSPTNILVREDQSLMLTDFELAKLVENGPTVSEDWPEDPYRAPEIGAGEPTRAADWYSWGRLVLHAVSGQLPEPGKEAIALAKKIPKEVAEVVAKCVQPRPSERPTEWSEMNRVIDAWLQTSLGAR